jgi:acyl-CoA synthetase (AMP-forming)/AMP-acid ligase II
MPRTLIDMLRSTADRVGDENGVRFYETRHASEFMGYAELDRSAKTIAAALAERGLVPGDVVVIAQNPGFDFIKAVYGALYAGVAVAPTAASGNGAPADIAKGIAGIAAASGAKLILSQDAVLDRLRDPYQDGAFGDVPVVTVSQLLQSGDPNAWVPPDIDENALAGLMFTSGSTGDPKGVIFTHSTLLAAQEVGRMAMNLSERSVLVGWLPFHHSFGLSVQVLLPVYLGASAVLTSTAQFQRHPIFWLQLISKHRATASAAANFAFGLCTQFATDEQVADLDLSSLEVISNGSEPVRTETVNAFLDRFASAGVHEGMFAPALGTTESMLVTMKRIGEKLFVVNADAEALESGVLRQAEPGQRAAEMVSCGPAAPLCEVAVVDPATGTRLPDGSVGEIWLSSPATSPGYWQRPDATAETFGARLPDDTHDYNRTGDLGALIDGELFITGRLKDLIIVRGRNIYPQDIEAAATRFHDAIGIGTAFELTGHPAEVGIVVEVDLDLVPADADELAVLARELRSSLVREFSLPSLAVAFLPQGELPRTAIGKVKRAFTRSEIEQGTLRVVYAEGFNVMERDASPNGGIRAFVTRNNIAGT